MRPLALLPVLHALGSGCIEFSPFETDLADDERAQNRKNLAELAASPEPGDSFRFAVVADSHQYADELSEIVGSINRRPGIDFVAHLGDMTDLGLREEYRATLGVMKRLRVPFVTVIGNHDAISNGKRVYQGMFGAYDYVFHRGFARFVCFNSNSLEFDSTPNIDWLAQQTVKAAGVESVVALSHQGPGEPDYAGVLEQNRSDLLITAHRHSFSLADEEELLRVTVGSASSGHWLVVTASAGRIGIESCIHDDCAVVLP
jgi:3',5'-cyclic-AMP phosphodiesterase